MRLVTALFILIFSTGSLADAQEVSVGDDRSATGPVTFNVPKKSPAQVKALIDSLLKENTTGYSAKQTEDCKSELSSQSGAK